MKQVTPELTKLPAGRAKTETIRVAEKIIADISTGIYRTPAAALKELVTNAYDAEATEVTISTGAPGFKTLVIHDNGNGMNIERFLEVLKHIGGSWKRIENPNGLTPTLNRPVIGRIGIGLLAVAQMGQRFVVSSTQRGSPHRFIAEVDLRPFHRDDAALASLGAEDAVDDGDPAKKDGQPKDAKGKRPNKVVKLGHVKYVDGLPEREGSHFTVITVLNPKQGLVSELHGQLRAAIGADAEFTLKNPAPNFRKLVEAALTAKRADTVFDSYHYLLWELGLLSPVPYDRDQIFETAKRVVDGADAIDVPRIDKFHLKVDKYDITRPIRFPTPCTVGYGGPDPIAYPFDFDRSVAGRKLRFTGYVYSQQPRIDPAELQGVQIRIRNVGIGGFDRTWMGYPFDEGMKFGQVSGEIFVHEGLESALNIDRASFRETDPHYLALRAWLWDFLKKTVFPDFKTRQDKYRNQKKKEAKGELEEKLTKALSKAPETVGVRPRPKQRPREEKPKVPATRPASPKSDAPPKPEARKTARHQSIVLVEDGEAAVDQEVLARVARAGAQRDRLLRVCAVLAAYGIWDVLSPDEAEEVLSALAVAVEV
jgi:hypothetical protein